MTTIEGWAWWATLTVFAVLPVWVLRVWYGAQWRWFLFGIASYVAGIVVKLLYFVAWEVTGPHGLAPSVEATMSGAVSAATELGAAALIFWLALRKGGRVGWPNALAFGAAIGVFEMLGLLPIGLTQIMNETGTLPTAGVFAGALGWDFLIERWVTVVGHTASRALLYIAIRYRSWLAGCLCFALFTLNDGAAAYPDLRGWEWTDALLRRFSFLFTALAAVEVTAAVLLARRYAGRPGAGAAGERAADAPGLPPGPPSLPPPGPAARVSLKGAV